MHYTGTRDIEDRVRQLCTPGSEISAHYVVLQDGYIIQLVPEALRAWHAGVSCYYLCQRLRSKSSAVRATAAMPLLIVLGFDDQQKPRGAKFVDAKPDLVTSCENL